MKRKLAARILQSLWPPTAAFAVVVLGLEILDRKLQIAPYLLPRPSDVAIAFVKQRRELIPSLAMTALAAGIGFGASAVVGISVAALLSTISLLRRALYPYTLFFQTVPIIAIAPLLVIWFDFGLTAVAASAFIASVFPVIANSLAGFLAVDPNLRDLFRLHSAGRWATLRKLTFPAALPQIITGLRIASGLSVIGAIVGEFVAGSLSQGSGLGVTVMIAKRYGQTDVIFAAVLLASLLGLTMFGAVQQVGYLLLRHWHASENS